MLDTCPVCILQSLVTVSHYTAIDVDTLNEIAANLLQFVLQLYAGWRLVA
jgi:hypothetical protein